MVTKSAPQDPGHAVTTAIGLLIRQGFAATSVEELADAAGMSRSTFFRRFGSKEDMIFADHERLLTRVSEHLSTSTVDPLVAVTEGALMVFEQHIRNREISLLRNQLLQQVQTLRDRELVTTHRYERAFRQYLLGALPESDSHDYGAVAFSAAVVAVHNRVLRQWLREAAHNPGHELDQNLFARLGREFHVLADTFRPTLFPAAVVEAGRPAVIVTVLDPGIATEQILDAVRKALPNPL